MLMQAAVLGKVEEDPVWWSFNEHYLPWHGHVTALTVAPQSRRLGLAQSLTKALERGCEQQNAWFVDLFVREGNKSAIDLYEGLGSVVPPFMQTLSCGVTWTPLVLNFAQVHRIQTGGRLLQR